MKAIIVSGGSPPDIELLNKELDESDYLICADSGANCLYEYKIIPNYLIGDFDSIDSQALDYISKSDCIVCKYPKEKDETDTQLALLKALEVGATEITFLGCTGNRLDHSLGNINLLYKCLDLGIKSSIRDNNNHIFLINKAISLKGQRGEFFSLLPFTTNIEGLTIEGAKYPLNNFNLYVGDSITLSNEFLNSEVMISFKSGLLLVIKSID